MHSMGLHSALAIKRQRKRRDEQKRARERRFSQQSNESGLGESQSSFMSPRSSMRERTRRGNRSENADALDSKQVVSSIGMMHIGVVFLVLGGFLLVSGLIPSDFTSWDQLANRGWFNELSVSGTCAVLVGIFLIVLNHFVAKKEEDDLTEYVQRQLTRSRSGHRLVRDVETGGLMTKHSHRPRSDTGSSRLNGFDSNGDLERMGSGDNLAMDASPSPINSPGLPQPISPPPHHHLHTDLEKILEEDSSEKGEEDCRTMERLNKEYASTGSSVSPGSPSETRELLMINNRMYNPNMVRI